MQSTITESAADCSRGIRLEGSQLTAATVDVRRLLVLVPDEGLDANGLARQVWTLATPCELQVYFLCVLSDATGYADRESAMRLRLATLASMIRDDRVEVTTRVVAHQDWVAAVRGVWQPGDLVLCCAEQKAPTVASGYQPLCHVLEYALCIPVFVLTGLYSGSSRPQPLLVSTLLRIGYWVVACALVVGFFVLDVQISQRTSGMVHTILLAAAGLVEIGLIALWSCFL